MLKPSRFGIGADLTDHAKNSIACCLHTFRRSATPFRPAAGMDFLPRGRGTGCFGSSGGNSGIYLEGILRVLSAFGCFGFDDISVGAASGAP